MLDAIKLLLRIKTNAFDSEINDLIEACKADLKLCGISAEKAEDTTDPLTRRAVGLYCKTHFGLNSPNKDLQLSYELLKAHLSLSSEYNGGDSDAV